MDPVVDAKRPQQNFGFAYSGNNPVTWSDPTGLAFDDCSVARRCSGVPRTSASSPRQVSSSTDSATKRNLSKQMPRPILVRGGVKAPQEPPAWRVALANGSKVATYASTAMTVGSALLVGAAAWVKHPLAVGVLSRLSSELGKASLMAGGLGLIGDCIAYAGDSKCAANVAAWGMSTMIGLTADAVGVPAGGAIGSAIFDVHMLTPEFFGEKPRPFPTS